MRRLILSAALAASLAACAGNAPFDQMAMPADPGERMLAGASLGAAAGAGIGATISLPFPVAVIPATAFGAATGAAMGGLVGLFTAPPPQ